MSQYVSDTAAGKSISAWVILKRGKPVARVQAAFTQSACLVNIFHFKGITSFQSSKASGYGYDKLTAALTGLTVDGHKLTDHCQVSAKRPAAGVWPYKAKAPKGFRFANYREADDQTPAGYSDCYRQSGLDYLKDVGYTIIQAL